MRLLYGGAAARTGVSIWTLAFSVFMFFESGAHRKAASLNIAIADVRRRVNCFGEGGYELDRMSNS